MSPLKSLSFLCILIAIALQSCNLSKNVSATSSASYQKLQIIQQANSQKEKVEVAKTSASPTKPKNNIALINPTTEKANYHSHSFKTKFSKVVVPCIGLASVGKAHVIIRQAKDMGVESTPKTALYKLGVAFLILIGGIILAVIGGLLFGSALFGSSNVASYAFFGLILLIVGLIGISVGAILFVIRFFQLIVQLLKESIRTSIKNPKSALKDAQKLDIFGWILLGGGIAFLRVIGYLQTNPLITLFLTIALIMVLIGVILLIISGALRGAAHEKMLDTNTK